MYKHRTRIYFVLFTLFFLLEALHLFPHFIPVGSPIEWMKPLGHYAPIALAVLLLFIIRIGEIGKEHLEQYISKASELVTRIDAESAKVNELATRTDEVSATTKALAEQVRSSDTLLYGKLFFLQHDYRAAIEIFEELYALNHTDIEVNKWLGLSLLRGKQGSRAVPILEFAARARQTDSELWFATGEAKFRSWDKSLFPSAEEDIQRALKHGLRNKENALTILAKLQLSRDRTLAKATLREALQQNPSSPPLVGELSRILVDEKDWRGIIELADMSLLVNRNNWSAYPIRAEAYIRRQEAGDLDRARSDIEDAKRGNARDFNIYRVEAEYLLAQARQAPTAADSRMLVTDARERIKKVQETFKGEFRFISLTTRARLSLLLGDSDDCAQCAEQVIRQSQNPKPAAPLLLCAALVQKRSWVQLSRAAQQMRQDFPVAAIHAWSSLYILLADLLSKQPLASVVPSIRQCEADLSNYPGFDPTVRPEWIENKWDLPLAELGNHERALALALREYLTGERSCQSFVEAMAHAVQSVTAQPRNS